MATVWQLIEDGHFQDACILADAEFSQNKGVFCLRNKVLALLCLGNLNESILTSQAIIKATNGSTDSDYIFQGVALWLQNKHSEALASWKDGMRCRYTDAAGGIESPLLLYYGATRLADPTLAADAVKILKAKIGKSIGPWPAPIAAYILKRMTSDEVMMAMSQNAVLKAKQLCQSLFCFGIRALETGDSAKASVFFREAAGLEPVTLTRHEHYLAKNESLVS